MIILDSFFMLSDEVIAPLVLNVVNCKYSSKGKLQITPNLQTELVKEESLIDLENNQKTNEPLQL